MRFWQELRNPKLKCERVGHKNVTQWRQGYMKPHWNDWDYRITVVNRVYQERRCCLRCGDASEWKITKKTGLNGLTASTQTWDQIDAGGHFFEQGRKKWIAEEVVDT